MLRISNIKLNIDDNLDDLRPAISKKLGIPSGEISGYSIYKESIDARKSDSIFFIYTVDVNIRDEGKTLNKLAGRDVEITPDMEYKFSPSGTDKIRNRPVIVGSGPAGLFCGLILAQFGMKPLILERGDDVDKRTQKVLGFWSNKILDPESNVQFGEGGAGTFSDGKLTTNIKDPRCRKVLEELAISGAPKDIIYTAKPHVGTDLLKTVVKNIRNRIIELGGKFLFSSKMTDVQIKDGAVYKIIVNEKDEIPVDVLVIAPGHSARDTFYMLHKKGLKMIRKPFSIGARIEHPQEVINKAQYKKFAGHKRLGAAEYKLVYHAKNGRSLYTFCMCPGGAVVASTSEEGCVVTNGMSIRARNGKNANSALLVGVNPEDFKGDHPLAGIEFQRTWEKKAFELGGSNYNAPAQLLGDFLKDKKSAKIGSVIPTYQKSVTLSELKFTLPDYVLNTMREGIPQLDKKLRGFALPDAVLTGVETRSSSPVRILRDENFETDISGIYPVGEGAGYAGGIMSAAVDGIKAAEAILKKFRI